jgi:hypothetical protein
MQSAARQELPAVQTEKPVSVAGFVRASARTSAPDLSQLLRRSESAPSRDNLNESFCLQLVERPRNRSPGHAVLISQGRDRWQLRAWWPLVSVEAPAQVIGDSLRWWHAITLHQHMITTLVLTMRAVYTH